MVPTKVMTEIRSLYSSLQSGTPNLSDYEGSMADAAFDIVSAQTFIGGVACTIINKEKLHADFASVLAKPVLKGTCWVAGSTPKELSGVPKLLSAAEHVERLRRACMKFTNGSS